MTPDYAQEGDFHRKIRGEEEEREGESGTGEKEEEEAKVVEKEKKISKKRWEGDLHPHTVPLRPPLGRAQEQMFV